MDVSVVWLGIGFFFSLELGSSGPLLVCTIRGLLICEGLYSVSPEGYNRSLGFIFTHKYGIKCWLLQDMQSTLW